MIRLKDDDYGVMPEVVLDNANGYFVAEFDVGFPEIRENKENRALSSGTMDFTRFHGESTVAMRVLVTNHNKYGRSRRDLVDAIMPYCRPEARGYLHWQLNDEPDSRCVRIRAGRVARPVNGYNRVELVCSWVVPRGIQESSFLFTDVLSPSDTITTPGSGRAYPLTFPRIYPAATTTGSGTKTINNHGTVEVYPFIRVYGSVTDPLIRNVTTGKQLRFQALTIPDDNYITIDLYNRQVLMNDDPSDSRLNSLVHGDSDWWSLVPGNNEILFSAAAYSGTRIEITYRYAWL